MPTPLTMPLAISLTVERTQLAHGVVQFRWHTQGGGDGVLVNLAEANLRWASVADALWWPQPVKEAEVRTWLAATSALIVVTPVDAWSWHAMATEPASQRRHWSGDGDRGLWWTNVTSFYRSISLGQ
ncbi:hypothetical protein [Actinophytocola sp.]|uniref:hypothetical protein n=1 Tax=Actinophytocola sp. TaxID=1872138 RepID=UPI003D6AA8AB